MMDGSTGRIWRYTRLTASDSEIKSFQELRQASKRLELGRELSKDELSQVNESAKEDLETRMNPCTGLVTCFLEVDRKRLLDGDKWTAEVPRK